MQANEGMKPIQALNRLVEIANGFCRSQTFFTACKLGLFEELSHGPATAEDLSQRINIHPIGCRRLLMALANLGLVEIDGDLFRNSELGRFCTSAAEVPLAPVAALCDPFYHMWEFLPDALREYSPRWQQALGTTAEQVFDALYEDPARLRRFLRMMNAYSVPQGLEIAARLDFTPYRCVMDVAGGSGGIAIQIGFKHPHLRGIIMDLAPVCKVAEEYIQASGLTGRYTTAAADLFKGPYPPGADVIVLGFILHDWSDDSCRKILRNCFEALPSGGALLVSEKVLNEDFSGAGFALLRDLMMLVACEPGARERSESEYRSLLEDAGFHNVEIIRLDAPRDLIVARKS
jgi:acetylserotonin N-methyltransferase